MQPLYDLDAPKKPTTLYINSDLLAKARVLNINLSATLEQALCKALVQAEAVKWAEDNKSAINAYNSFVDTHGCFGDEFREFWWNQNPGQEHFTFHDFSSSSK